MAGLNTRDNTWRGETLERDERDARFDQTVAQAGKRDERAGFNQTGGTGLKETNETNNWIAIERAIEGAIEER
jgi:hypothetical protein